LIDWIIPLKITSYYLDQIAYFGLGATPDRRDVIYVCTAAAIVSFGIVNRMHFIATNYGFDDGWLRSLSNGHERLE
jgi:hypothetical protein